MMIAVAGPYSAPTASERQANLDAMNRAAAEVMRRGHVPVIGVNAALAVVDALEPDDRNAAIMAISLALVERCDAILMIGESPGANRERDLMVAKGRPVYRDVDELPVASCARGSATRPEVPMTIQLDHLMVPSRDKIASAKLLGELLGVPWSETGVGPFSPVHVNDGLTLDFDEWPEPIPLIHYCFRVSDEEFDAILGRIRTRGIAYRSAVHGPVDSRVDTEHGGRIVYWNEPDGHQWEMLTLSYDRPTK